VVALQTKKGVPFEFLTLELCRELHCLPSQLRQESWQTMELFLDMMNIEHQFSEKDNRLAQQKHAKRNL